MAENKTKKKNKPCQMATSLWQFLSEFQFELISYKEGFTLIQS